MCVLLSKNIMQENQIIKKKFEERKEMNETNVEKGMSGSMCMFQGKKSIEA